MVKRIAFADAIKGKLSCRLNAFDQICVCRAKPATNALSEEGRPMLPLLQLSLNPPISVPMRFLRTALTRL